MREKGKTAVLGSGKVGNWSDVNTCMKTSKTKIIKIKKLSTETGILMMHLGIVISSSTLMFKGKSFISQFTGNWQFFLLAFFSIAQISKVSLRKKKRKVGFYFSSIFFCQN